MSGKVALVMYAKCRPSECPGGVCLAAQACTRKLLQQEAPYEVPVSSPSVCGACSDCVRACPQKALQVVVM